METTDHTLDVPGLCPTGKLEVLYKRGFSLNGASTRPNDTKRSFKVKSVDMWEIKKPQEYEAAIRNILSGTYPATRMGQRLKSCAVGRVKTTDGSIGSPVLVLPVKELRGGSWYLSLKVFPHPSAHSKVLIEIVGKGGSEVLGIRETFERLHKYYVGITTSTVAEYLPRIPNKQTHMPKPSVSMRKTTVINSKGPHRYLLLDTSFTPTEMSNCPKILFMIDHFTKFGWAFPVSSGKAEKTWSKTGGAIRSELRIFEEIWGGKPGEFVIHTDGGSEFKGKTPGEFDREVTDLGIDLVHGQPYHPWSQGAIERFGKTIKRKLEMYMTGVGNMSWIRYLQKCVDSYNDTKHSTTGYTPMFVHQLTSQVNARESHKVLDIVNELLGKTSKRQLKLNNLWADKDIIQQGSFVRLLLEDQKETRSKQTSSFRKKYLANWSSEVYIIVRVRVGPDVDPNEIKPGRKTQNLNPKTKPGMSQYFRHGPIYYVKKVNKMDEKEKVVYGGRLLRIPKDTIDRDQMETVDAYWGFDNSDPNLPVSSETLEPNPPVLSNTHEPSPPDLSPPVYPVTPTPPSTPEVPTGPPGKESEDNKSQWLTDKGEIGLGSLLDAYEVSILLEKEAKDCSAQKMEFNRKKRIDSSKPCFVTEVIMSFADLDKLASMEPIQKLGVIWIGDQEHGGHFMAYFQEKTRRRSFVVLIDSLEEGSWYSDKAKEYIRTVNGRYVSTSIQSEVTDSPAENRSKANSCGIYASMATKLIFNWIKRHSSDPLLEKFNWDNLKEEERQWRTIVELRKLAREEFETMSFGKADQRTRDEIQLQKEIDAQELNSSANKIKLYGTVFGVGVASLLLIVIVVKTI